MRSECLVIAAFKLRVREGKEEEGSGKDGEIKERKGNERKLQEKEGADDNRKITGEVEDKGENEKEICRILMVRKRGKRNLKGRK